MALLPGVHAGSRRGQFAHFAYYARPEHRYPYAIERFRNELERQLKVMEGHLTGRDWFADEYSIADMVLLPYAVSWLGARRPELPNLTRWYDTMLERPAVKRGMALLEDCVQAATIAGGMKGFTDEHRSVLFGDRQHRR